MAGALGLDSYYGSHLVLVYRTTSAVGVPDELGYGIGDTAGKADKWYSLYSSQNKGTSGIAPLAENPFLSLMGQDLIVRSYLLLFDAKRDETENELGAFFNVGGRCRTSPSTRRGG